VTTTRAITSAVAAFTAASLAVVLVGCGGGKGARGSAPTSTSSAASPPTSTTPPPSGFGPVPRGFNPVSFTAISADEFWLLGDAACPTTICTSIVRTSDEGKNFVSIPAPHIPLTDSNDAHDSIDTLRFATPLVGYAFNAGSFRRADASSDPIWETTDGGAHWQHLMVGDVHAFATGDGFLYLLTGHCHAGVCRNLVLRRAPLGTTDWVSTSLPVSAAESIILLAVHGSAVWISASPTSGHQNQILLNSTDNGAHFTAGTSPCVNGLGGDLQATSTNVLWAICPTGMLAGAFRSTDGGVTWTTLQVRRGLSNGAQIAPADDATAVILTGDQTQLLRTVDGGATFTQVFPPRAGWWDFIGFTDAQTGNGIRTLPGKSPRSLGPPLAELMRSNDGGATWARTKLR
jgi:photosystem II stability/assembly factor-like uncharacterized protein